MSRLAPLTEDQLNDEQKVLWKNLTTGPRANPNRPGGGLAGDDGALIGPFNAMLYSPVVGDHVQALGGALRFNTSLPRHLLELAICTVGAEWKAQFEFWAHSRMAREAGLDEAIIEAIRAGELPEVENADEKVVFAFCREMLDMKRVSDATYKAAVDLLGDAGVMELASLMGYYSLVSMILNTFEVPVPAGQQAPFEE